MSGPPDRDPVIPLPTTAESALQSARAMALAELRAAPTSRGWRREAVRLMGTVAGATLLGAAVVFGLNATVASNLIASRLPGLLLLAVAQGTGLWAALAPGRSRWGAAAVVMAALGIAAVLTARGQPGAAALPGWICSASHLAAAVFPVLIVAMALRNAAWSARRAILAGIAVGSAGLIWGEIACERDVSHVVIHHGGAWLVLIVACVMASRLMPRRSFAP